MIGILQKGHYIKGLLEYHYKKIEDGSAKILNTNVYSDKFKDQLGFYLDNFSTNNNSRVTDFVFHSSLSFSPEEIISEKMMDDISQDYMYNMGYRDVPYTVFVHNDTNHQHLHIVASRINFDGEIDPKKHKKTTFDRKINKEQCKAIEKKYNLIIAQTKSKAERRNETLAEINMQKFAVSNAIQKHIKLLNLSEDSKLLKLYQKDNQPTDFELRKILGKDYHKIEKLFSSKGLIKYSKKHYLNIKLNSALKDANSIEDFTAKLHNIDAYGRKLLDKTGTPYMVYGLKGENFYVNEKHISKKFQFNSIKEIKNDIELKSKVGLENNTKKELSSTLNKISRMSRNILEFELNLKEEGIDFEYSYTKNNTEIQGIKFKDNSGTSTWYKGSEINRNLSWSNINKNFNSSLTKSKRKSYRSKKSIVIDPKDLKR